MTEKMKCIDCGKVIDQWNEVVYHFKEGKVCEKCYNTWADI